MKIDTPEVQGMGTIYFQGPFKAEGVEDGEFWKAVHGQTHLTFFFLKNTLVQVDTEIEDYDFVPGCEAEGSDGTCRCKMSDDAEKWAHLTCPFRVLEDSFSGGGSDHYEVALVDGKLKEGDLSQALLNSAAPAFFGESSLIALMRLQWRFMDGKENPVFFDGVPPGAESEAYDDLVQILEWEGA